VDGIVDLSSATKLYYVYAVELNSAPALIASNSSVAPFGFAQARLVGHLSLNSSGQIIHVYYLGQLDQESLLPKQNLIINGNFDIWQRGITFSNTINLYIADRWYLWHQLSTATRLISDLVGSQYFIRWWNVNGVGESNLLQAIEQATVTRLIGKKLTLSFWMRKGPLTTGNINIYIGTNSSSDARVPQASDLLTANVTALVGATWTKVVITTAVDVPSTAKGITISLTHQGMTLFGANDYLDLTQVQLVEGAIATPFQISGLSPEGELSLCQRCFCKTYRQDDVPGSAVGDGRGGLTARWPSSPPSNNELIAEWNFPVTMRTIPSVISIWSTTGVPNTWKRDSGSSIGASIHAESISESRLAITNSAPTDTSFHRCHVTAEAEL